MSYVSYQISNMYLTLFYYYIVLLILYYRYDNYSNTQICCKNQCSEMTWSFDHLNDLGNHLS
jgi:hypothetical protein